jgi:hypothetical protein
MTDEKKVIQLYKISQNNTVKNIANKADVSFSVANRIVNQYLITKKLQLK